MVKLGGLMHRFGDQPRTYYSQNDRLPYSDGNKTMGALVANRRTGSHFLGASSLKNEKNVFFHHFSSKKLTNRGASDLTSKINQSVMNFSKVSYFTT